MLSPNSVSRVTPLTTMTAETTVEESISQFLTTGGGRWEAGSSVVPLEEKNPGSSAGLIEGVPSSLKNEYGHTGKRNG